MRKGFVKKMSFEPGVEERRSEYAYQALRKQRHKLNRKINPLGISAQRFVNSSQNSQNTSVGSLKHAQ